MKLLSIVTPAYNRSRCLVQCMESLRRQSDRRFEWIIVDDGSTDDTQRIAASFQSQLPDIAVRCIRKENGGKHTAMNAAIPHINGDYVLILDSDDRLTEDAVAEVHRGWERHDREDVGVVVFLKGYDVRDPLAVGIIEDEPVDMYREYRKSIHNRDCCDVFRTEAFKACPFPVFPDEKYLSLGVLWHQMAADYRVVYINKVICLAEYLEDGLTKAGRAMRIRNPAGGMYAANLYTDRRYPAKLRLKNGLLYNCYGFFANAEFKTVREQAISRAVMYLTRPGGYLLYRYWEKKHARSAK